MGFLLVAFLYGHGMQFRDIGFDFVEIIEKLDFW